MSLALRQAPADGEVGGAAACVEDVAASGAGVPVRCALLGVGTVGGALLQRWERLARRDAAPSLRLVALADSRRSATRLEGLSPHEALDKLADADPNVATFDPLPALGERGTRIVIDATASDAVASRHPEWLARGIHVVTACKLGQGSSLTRWRRRFRSGLLVHVFALILP